MDNLKFKEILVIETDDEELYNDFGVCDNKEFSIKKKYGIEGLEECLFDKFSDDEEDEDLYGEEYLKRLSEVLPEYYVEFLDLIKEKLETYEEIQVRLKK